MPDTFDPYYKWLGIPPAEQPPDFYRLLGINRFEVDFEVIESAVEQRINHLRLLQSGPHGADSQRLLNELASAKLCLLKPERKREYDDGLRMRMALQSPVGSPPNGWEIQLPPQPVLSNSGGPKPPDQLRPVQAAETGTAQQKADDDGIELEGLGISPPPSVHSFHQAALPPVLWIAGPIIFAIIVLVAVLQISGALNRADRTDSTNVALTPPASNTQARIRASQASVSPSSGGLAEKRLPESRTDSERGTEPFDLQDNRNPPVQAPSSSREEPVAPPSTRIDSDTQTLQPAVTPVAQSKPSETSAASSDPFADLSRDDSGVKRRSDSSGTKRHNASGARAIVPSEIAQQDSLREIRSVLREEFVEATTPSLQLALAQKLERLAAETTDDSKMQYVLRSQAIELAVRSGEVDLVADLVARLNQSFDVDAWSLRLKAWSRLPQFLSSENRATFVHRAIQFTNESIADDRYDIAVEMAGLADSVAGPLKDKSIRDKAHDSAERAKHMQTAAATASAAIETLLCDPNDPRANLIVGKFRCFDKQDWERGLVYLARGSDSALRELARREIQPPIDAAEELELADAWYALAEKSGEPKTDTWRSPLHVRGIHWYRQAMPSLSGLALLKAQKRSTVGTSLDVQTP